MIDKAIGMHEKALGMRNQRMEVLARNIANADTPNYKAQDLDFKALLKDTQDFAMKTSHANHIEMAETDAGGGLKFRVPFNVAFDGNTVELNVEQAKYGKSAGDYQATLNFLEQRVSGIRKALRGE